MLKLVLNLKRPKSETERIYDLQTFLT